jgi:hypothetical protein
MASRALPVRLRLPGLLAELVDRQPMLARYGVALLVLALVGLAMQALDPRQLAGGENVWLKPTKFLVSVGVFSLTAAWFFGYVRPERRGSPAMRRTAAVLVLAGSLELAWIVWQGAHGLESHFNNDTLLFSVMYTFMGVFAVLLLGTTLPLAWEIGRRPAAGLERDFVAAVVAGLLLTFLLGGILGGYMSAQPGHAVGAEGGRVPLFGWNRSGGDLRIAHFLGIHAEQAIPLLAASVAGAAARTRWLVLMGGTTLYLVLTLAVFAQAVAARPLLPL